MRLAAARRCLAACLRAPAAAPAAPAAEGARLRSMAAAAAGEAAAAPAPRRVSAVVFDMDGTLTVPVIDFQLMYDRVGVPRGHDVLAAISEWPAAEQQRALDVIAEFEEAALRDMQLMPGVVDLARLLDDTGIPRALVTRNVCKSVDHLHAHHIAPLPPFLPALSRNTCVPKPAPDALLRVAEHWGVPPTELLMVGDSARDDVVAGNRAGAVTVLLDMLGHYTGQELQGEERPHFLVTSLHELRELMSTELELRPPAARQP